MTQCIIAEKPSVARDIAKIVGATHKQDGYIEGSGYLVTWAMGHLVALAMPEAYGFGQYKAEDLPIIPVPFQLIVRQVRKGKDYSNDPAAMKQLKVIRDCFERSDSIVVATDAGREGELIFRWIYNHLGCRKPFRRLWISSLTDKAIREGMAALKTGDEYDRLYLSAQARAEADWLVGINASRALSMTRRGGYSLGRVQTPTLAMICRRTLENRDFQAVPYWKIQATVEKNGTACRTAGTETFDNEAAARAALDGLRRTGSLTVKTVARKAGHTPPPLLFDLTDLQKEANRRYGFTADKTLSIAQSLYEKKVTTYPRTGSRYISEDVYEEMPDLLMRLGVIIPLPLNRRSVDNAQVTDHHALLPTGETAASLSPDEETVYRLILTRVQEAFSPPSEEERMTVELTAGDLSFSWKGCRILSLGWKGVARSKDKVDGYVGPEDKEEDAEYPTLPDFKEGETLALGSADVTRHTTKPKPLYTEASLLTAMETAGREVEDTDSRKAMADCGIGTPATRANIIETLVLRGYVAREKKTLVATDKGLSVYDLVKGKQIADAEMTGVWEVSLAAIEAGAVRPEDFSERIRAYAGQICRELLDSAPPRREYPVYTCPKCGQASVGIFSKVALCKNEGCGFHVFRNVCGKTLTERQVQDLLDKGKTSPIEGFVSKKGKTFAASIVLQADFTTAFSFEEQPKKKRPR